MMKYEKFPKQGVPCTLITLFPLWFKNTNLNYCWQFCYLFFIFFIHQNILYCLFTYTVTVLFCKHFPEERKSSTSIHSLLFKKIQNSTTPTHRPCTGNGDTYSTEQTLVVEQNIIKCRSKKEGKEKENVEDIQIRMEWKDEGRRGILLWLVSEGKE